MKHRPVLFIAALSGAAAVAIGAFGAHLLRETLLLNGRQDTFELAVRYQFYHTLALLGVGLLKRVYKTARLTWSAFCFIGGIGIFSGSLYILSLTNETVWGAVTPIGGVLMIAGWIFLAIGVTENKKAQA